MMPWEKVALTGILSRLKPKVALEIGVYYGGSLSLTCQYAERIYAIDIDPAVLSRFSVPPNAQLEVGDSSVVIKRILDEIRHIGAPLNFVLIDADHSEEGVRRDIEEVLKYVPSEPMVIMMHDSGNIPTRAGIRSANWSMNPHVEFVDLDFVPGQIIEHSVQDGKGEVWGGFALAYLNPQLIFANTVILESAKTSVTAINEICRS